ncbi:pentatricopeptide repeat-containing protein At2g02750 [Telopea speciosissima]|uniref:pentatricopeptide repeat-containing protein At2g02750 n=1 Tax=Telopea speciosissima TaxID=54955 RepID=UPI001CC342E0|nr:pentatricopeptide repeat-containing protein At2g02750 [Telopea speciosissima]
MKGDIRKLVSDGLNREALSVYSQLHSTGFRPDYFTFPFILKACGKLHNASLGCQMHAYVQKSGFLADVYTRTALTDMYMKLHLFEDAIKVSKEMPERNLASLNATISGFSRNGYLGEALRGFKQVCATGLRPNSVTIASVLPACEITEHGLQIHCLAIKLGFEVDVYVATATVTMYSNCKDSVSATRMFCGIPNKNVVSYNTLISGFLQDGLTRLVLNLFNEMRESLGRESSPVTFASVLSACSELSDHRLGRQVHCLSLKYVFGSDVMVGTALLNMYSKFGSWVPAYEIFKELGSSRNLITWNSMISGLMLNDQCDAAVQLFEELGVDGLEPDSATWNSMISGFAQLRKGYEAYTFFNKMQSAGVTPNLKSITSLLVACSTMSALLCGKEIHGYIIRTGVDADEMICTALIDLYMKCGCSSWARNIFDQIESSDDPALWNAMISGYGRNGEIKSALEIFNLMKKEGIQPNLVTFTCVISACSHNGCIDEGFEIFRMMSRDCGLSPTTVHFSGMVDLLGRAGLLKEARDLIQEMPEPPPSVFSSLLGAASFHSDSKLGEEMAVKLSELEPTNPTPYVILSNIYATQGRFADVERVREMMRERGLRKLPGHSLL